MADPGLIDGLIALAALASGALGTKGVQRFRRRNGYGGPSDADRIVEALKEEGGATRKLTHECHEEMKGLLGSVLSDTRVLLDREGR